MLKFKNKILTSDKEFIISDSDAIIKIDSDIDCIMFGVFTLSDKSTKTIQFSKCNDGTKARLLLSELDLPLINSVTFALHLTSDTGTFISNSISVLFDIAKIKLNVTRKSSVELLETLKALKLLEDKINSIVANHRLLGVNITNSDYIKPGMIPVAVDDKGNFIAQYPFANIITNVNGQTAVDGVVNVDASMIKYNQEIMLDAYIKQLAESVKAVSDFATTISQTLRSTVESLQELRLKVETHLDNGLI